MAGERTDDLAAWDGAAAAYTLQSQVDWFDGFLERHLGDVEGKRVLDLGCGHGWFTHELHQRGADVVGVDGSQELLARARGRYPEVRFEQADLRQRYVGEFDVVVALMVLMDIPDLATLEMDHPDRPIGPDRTSARRRFGHPTGEGQVGDAAR